MLFRSSQQQQEGLTCKQFLGCNRSAPLNADLNPTLHLDRLHCKVAQVQFNNCCNAGFCSPRHLAVPVRLPAPLLPRPQPQPRPHHHASRRHASPLCLDQHTTHQKCRSTGAVRGAGQGRGQVRGLLGPGAPERGASKGSKQGRAGKVVSKVSNGCRVVVPTRQQEEGWQTRCVPSNLCSDERSGFRVNHIDAKVASRLMENPMSSKPYPAACKTWQNSCMVL